MLAPRSIDDLSAPLNIRKLRFLAITIEAPSHRAIVERARAFGSHSRHSQLPLGVGKEESVFLFSFTLVCYRRGSCGYSHRSTSLRGSTRTCGGSASGNQRHKQSPTTWSTHHPPYGSRGQTTT